MGRSVGGQLTLATLIVGSPALLAVIAFVVSLVPVIGTVLGALVIVAALAGAALGRDLGALVAVPVAPAELLIFDRTIIPHQRNARQTL